MAAPVLRTYEPIHANVKIYDELFAEYRRLHDYFGRGENDVMKRLKRISRFAFDTVTKEIKQ